jgi:EpsI family protein
LAGIVATAFLLPRPTEIFPSRAAFAEFPMRLGGWRGHRDSLDGIYLAQLKLDDYLLADFTDSSGRAASLYMAYYDSQRKGEAVHSPRSCLPGGGWQMREFGTRTLPGVSLNGRPLEVNRAVVEMGNARELVYYWFQQRGRSQTSEFAVKWDLFVDALTRHRTDGALVRLITALPPGVSEEAGDERLTALAAGVAPGLTRFVPN